MAMIDRTLREQAAAAPTVALAVIVTVEPALDNDRLAAAGLVVAHRVDRLSMVSGTLKGADIERLAALPGVVRIEADSPMRAC